ncbi:hypothetical protein BKA62DRAFT_197842 [Auriculariales sp. MPI-PUGE-AT-0066]|nr:hypothetical protein BKA62DRAFT_197842 [Auriculariales sp. MPI-PUGE-AT-0066]
MSHKAALATFYSLCTLVASWSPSPQIHAGTARHVQISVHLGQAPVVMLHSNIALLFGTDYRQLRPPFSCQQWRRFDRGHGNFHTIRLSRQIGNSLLRR